VNELQFCSAVTNFKQFDNNNFAAENAWVKTGCVWNVMARAETRFRLSAKRTSPFKSAGASVQSTTGSRVVCISGSNAGYTMLRGSVKSTGY
jgi:hypothetical protein